MSSRVESRELRTRPRGRSAAAAAENQVFLMFLSLFLRLNERTRGFYKNTPAGVLLNLDLCV